MNDVNDTDLMLKEVPADGTPVGNVSLRERLGWDEVRYEAAKETLLAEGVLEKGRGRGGAVKRAVAGPKEMFAEEEVRSAPPPEVVEARLAKQAGETVKGKKKDGPPVMTYQFENAQRKNIPPAGLATQNVVKENTPHELAYDPHLSPVLRFDSTSGTDELTARADSLLEKATRETLSPEETQELREAILHSRQPWLEWAGKREKRWFEVDPVALHIHERVSASAILKAAQREDIEHDLFADPKLSREEAMQFYKHDVDWANRLILGDSLQVMTSLSRREGLAGQVQMIYIDPPYGIKFSSNWQNEVGIRDVKDKDEDMTREPEMIKAYRDTWTLGVHSYLDYLKQRLLLARELLNDTGSVFVQISDENLHRVRTVMDEVFGADNYIAVINLTKTSGQTAEFLPVTTDYLLWYGRIRKDTKFKALFEFKNLGGDGGTMYNLVENNFGATSTLDKDQIPPIEGKILRLGDITSQRQGRASGEGSAMHFEVECNGKKFTPPGDRGWTTTIDGMNRLSAANRLSVQGQRLTYRRYLNDFPVFHRGNQWSDIAGTQDRRYVVQTAEEAIKRCLLMTSEPGDLVLDPTCGSGTTAFVAESWGRRWITIDSSRVAVAIARQRVLTAKFDAYRTKDPSEGVDPNKPKNPGTGFLYKTVPHITLKSIAQEKALDSIFEKHEPILQEALERLNAELAGLPAGLRDKLVAKLIRKHQEEGSRQVNDADKRRWLLPGTDSKLIQSLKGGKGLKAVTAKQASDYRESIPTDGVWREWEVPFDTDPDWPEGLREALTVYRAAWRAKMDEVNACIEANAEQEELVDQPEVLRGVVRVSGPFTVESVRPLEESLKGFGSMAPQSPIGGEPEELEDSFEPERDVTNAGSHIERMVGLLRVDGLTFIGNRHMKFARLDPMQSEFLHADGETEAPEGEEPRRVAVVIGPQHGAVSSFQVSTAVSSALQRGYDELVFAAFSFDAVAQDRIHEANENPAMELAVHMAQIRPDVLMEDLLKGNKAGGKAAETAKASQQLFTVFGQPRTRVVERGGEWVAHMEGVDVYDPVKNSIEATKPGKVAAWFLDSDYDGRTFCVCQAFFPDESAWDKLAKALGDTVDKAAFEAFSGTESLPFRAGPHGRVAVKVIDARGNEVMRVHSLEGDVS